MGINALMQEGLSSAITFQQQVDAIVKQQAIIKVSNNGQPDLVPVEDQAILAEVMKYPTNYGFSDVLVADPGWGVTFDGWAGNPAGADGAILAGVQKYFKVLTKVSLQIIPPP